MDDATRLKFLKVALIVYGLIYVFGVYALMAVWPAGWSWEPRQPEYEQMIVGVYAVLGIFLLRASRDPLEHLSLIWFYRVVERGARRHYGGPGVSGPRRAGQLDR